MRTAGTYEYTLNMESIFEDKFSALKSYYCREDFVQALEDVRRARSDAKEFRKKIVQSQRYRCRSASERRCPPGNDTHPGADAGSSASGIL